MRLTNLDIHGLRALVLAQELGSFSRAAEVLRLTPSAVSLQMKRLQADVGAPLFRRAGRQLLLTPQGDLTLRYARRLLDMNDELLDVVRGASLSGVVRIGFAQDFVETVLTPALSRFSSFYPHVQLAVQIDRNRVLEDAMRNGELDLALTLGEAGSKTARQVGELPLHWIAKRGWAAHRKQPLPLVLFEEPCIFRSRALNALDEAGLRWRVALTSPSVAGLWAAVSAGLGVTPRAQVQSVEGLETISEGLPLLGSMGVWLHRRKTARGPSVGRLADLVAELAATACNLAATT